MGARHLTPRETLLLLAEVPHPRIRTRFSRIIPPDDPNHAVMAADYVTPHFSGFRAATYREAIELEASDLASVRPSLNGAFDCRSALRKLLDWLWMLLRHPSDAVTLLRIDRHPPMITWDYDDSDDWEAKRWTRALWWHRKRTGR